MSYHAGELGKVLTHEEIAGLNTILLGNNFKFVKMNVTDTNIDNTGSKIGRIYNIIGKSPNLGDMCVATFSLYDLPGCCGVLVSTATHVAFHNKGIGTWLQKVKERLAVGAGYSLLLCTHKYSSSKDNAQTKLMNRAGWKEALTFLNKRTANHIVLRTKLLVGEEEESEEDNDEY